MKYMVEIKWTHVCIGVDPQTSPLASAKKIGAKPNKSEGGGEQVLIFPKGTSRQIGLVALEHGGVTTDRKQPHEIYLVQAVDSIGTDAQCYKSLTGC
jgi:hypothetical protein